MPLQDQNIQVPIGAGLDQKTDQRLLPPGKVTQLVNGVFDKLGTIKKRQGNQPLPSLSLVSSSVGQVQQPVPPMQQLATYKQELVGIDTSGASVWTVSPQANSWSQIDHATNCNIKRISIASQASEIGGFDCVYCNGFVVVSWIGQATGELFVGALGQVYFTVLDATTFATVVPPTLATSPRSEEYAINAKLTAVPNENAVILTYVSNLNSAGYVQLPLNAVKITVQPGQPVTFTKPYVGITTHQLHDFWVYDTWSDGTYLYVVYGYNTNTSGAGNEYGWIDSIRISDMVVLFDFFWGPLANAWISVGASGVDIGGTNYLTVEGSYQLSGTNKIDLAQAEGINPQFSSLSLSPTVIHSDTSLNGNTFSAGNGVACMPDGTGQRWAVLWQNSKDQPGPGFNPTLGDDQPQVVANLYQITGGSATKLTPDRQNWQLGFSNKPWWVPDKTTPLGFRCYTIGDIFFTNQATGLVMDVGVHDTHSALRQWRTVGTFAPRILAGLSVVGEFILGNTTTDGNGKWYTCCAVATAGAGSEATQFDINVVVMDFNSQTQFHPVEMGEDLHFSGGTPFYYDGAATGEVGFFYYPDPTIMQVEGDNQGQIEGPGTYQYALVWEWQDNRGQRHQSAPSIQQAITVTGSGYVNAVEIFLPNMCVTDRVITPVSGVSNFVNLAIYRSILNGTILYRLTPEHQVFAPADNATVCYPFSASLDYIDRQSAGAGGFEETSNEVLYTAGGVLANFEPPSSKLATSFDQRIWLSGQDNPKNVQYSQPYSPGSAVNFNDSLAFTVDDGGDITAIAGMDDNFIIFKSDRIFYVNGSPPNALGQQNNLSNPIPIPSDVGCINPRSVVLTPDGLMFQSSIGIHLLSRALEVMFIGGNVTDTLATYPNITSAVIHPTQNQVRFTCSASPLNSQASYFTAGVTLVYDYLAKAWSIFQITDSTYVHSSGQTNLGGVQVAGATAVVHQGTYKWGSASGWQVSGSLGSLYYETSGTATGSFGDGDFFVPLQVTTAWMSINDLQGIQRVKRIHVLGQAFDVCSVDVSYAIDYEPTFYTYAANNFGTPSGTPNASMRFHVGNQKCEAIQIRLNDALPESSPPPSSGQGFGLTRVTLVAGAKKGLQKLPPAQSQ
jgi:hypothetical protein